MNNHYPKTFFKEVFAMRLIEWEVAEDGYEEQIVIPSEKRKLAAEEGIDTENRQKVTVRITNLRSGESVKAGRP